MKKILREHDKGEGLCRSCGKRVATAYRYRDVDSDDPRLKVPNVLVAVCERCETIVSVPWQSNQRLQVARRAELERLAKPARIEARVPSELYEYLRLIAAHLEARDEAFSSLMLRYYLTQLSKSPRFAGRVHRLASSRQWGPASRRVSLRVSARLHDEALRVAERHGMPDQSALVRGLISAAWEDVFSGSAPQRRAFLESLADATN